MDKAISTQGRHYHANPRSGQHAISVPDKSSFAACRALFTYAQQVQIACAIGEAIEALTAGLQKVSAQFELNKPAAQTVLNDQ